MSIDDMSKYDELKEFLLAEYKLTPREYKIRFKTAAKMPVRPTICLPLVFTENKPGSVESQFPIGGVGALLC